MSWKAIAFSEAGTSHQNLGLSCQDYANFIKLDDFGETVNDGDIIIGAVSKGYEGCKYSDIGSQLAIETALNYLQDRIKFVGVNEAKKNCLLDISKEEADLAVRQLFLQTVEKVSKTLDVKSQELRCYPQDLSCDLLVVLATPKWLAAMRIGDGLIVTQQPESEPQLLFNPIERNSANQTTFLPANNASELMQFKISEGQELIFASTGSLKPLPIIKGKTKNWSFFDRLRKGITSSSEDRLKAIIQKDDYFKNILDNKAFLFCFYKSPLLELNDLNKLLTKQIDELKGELETLQSNNQFLNTQLDRSDTQLSILQSEHQELTENLEEKKQELSKLRSAREALTQKVERLELYHQELTEKPDERDNKISYLQDEKQALIQKLDDAETQLSQQYQKLNIFKKIAISSTIISTIIATALAGLSFIQYQERNQLIRQIEQIRRQNNLSPGQWDLSSYSLDRELENLGNMIKDEKPLVSDDLDELINKMQENTETNINQREQRISNLEATKADLENQNNSRQNRINELENQNNSRQNRINELENQNNSRQNRINELVNQNQSLQNRIKELEGETTPPI
jgi:hypothetical protein